MTTVVMIATAMLTSSISSPSAYAYSFCAAAHQMSLRSYIVCTLIHVCAAAVCIISSTLLLSSWLHRVVYSVSMAAVQMVVATLRGMTWPGRHLYWNSVQRCGDPKLVAAVAACMGPDELLGGKCIGLAIDDEVIPLSNIPSNYVQTTLHRYFKKVKKSKRKSNHRTVQNRPSLTLHAFFKPVTSAPSQAAAPASPPAPCVAPAAAPPSPTSSESSSSSSSSCCSGCADFTSDE